MRHKKSSQETHKDPASWARVHSGGHGPVVCWAGMSMSPGLKKH
ncbi:MAG: hypothetical protein RLZZ153_1507 [Pseudomonadota bacterium]|jgi:hypothetical protein